MPTRTDTVDLRPLRAVGVAMLGAAAVWPLLPVHPPISCPLRAATGVPCPFCGMTRAVTAAVHGDLAGSLRANPGGILVVVLAIVLALTWRVEWGRALRIRTPVLVAALGLLWVWNIGFNPTF